jgi:hypothetical protein
MLELVLFSPMMTRGTFEDCINFEVLILLLLSTERKGGLVGSLTCLIAGLPFAVCLPSLPTNIPLVGSLRETLLPKGLTLIDISVEELFVFLATFVDFTMTIGDLLP